MGKLLRRLRGLAGVGITWGAMWAGIGAGIGLIIGIVDPDVWRWTNPIIEWAYASPNANGVIPTKIIIIIKNFSTIYFRCIL